MRFKAKLANEQVSLLYSLVGPVSRLAADNSSTIHNASGVIGSHWTWKGGTIVFLDEKHLRLSTKGTSTGNDADGIACFAELTTTGGIFLEHRVESAANNEIVFEIDLVQLRMALQSIVFRGGSKENNYKRRSSNSGSFNNNSNNMDVPPPLDDSITVLKLAKRHVRGGSGGLLPCLCIDASAGAGGAMQVHHAIPVRIMRAAEMQYHLPPQINLPDVQLEIPIDRPLRTVVERLKGISPHVYLDANMAGELTLRVDNEGSSIRTFFSKLIPRFDDCKDPDETSSEPAKVTLKVDTKKLSSCLQWQVSLTGVTCPPLLCLVENEMLVMHVMLDPSSLGFFTFYLPVHFLSRDWGDSQA